MPSKIRVLHLGSPTGLYGAERWILALVRHLPAARVESLVGTIQDAAGPPPPLCERAAELGLATHVLEARGRFNLGAVSLLRRLIRTTGVQVVHTHGYKTDIVGFLATRGTSCKTVSTPHGWSTDIDAKVRVYEALDRFVLRRFDVVAPLSEGLLEGLRVSFGAADNLRLIRNAVDLSEVDATLAPAPEFVVRRAQGDTLIGYIGRLVKPKGIATLIKAFAALKVPGKRLLIIGEGPERPGLERLAQQVGVAGCTHFLGYRDDRFALLKALDVFVLPSWSEGIPRCLLEAMAARVPVVATDIPGCRALVEDGVTGQLFGVDDHAALQSRIEGVLDDAASCAAMVANADAFVRREYSAETMARSYAELYAELIDGPVRQQQLAGSASR